MIAFWYEYGTNDKKKMPEAPVFSRVSGIIYFIPTQDQGCFHSFFLLYFVYIFSNFAEKAGKIIPLKNIGTKMVRHFAANFNCFFKELKR